MVTIDAHCLYVPVSFMPAVELWFPGRRRLMGTVFLAYNAMVMHAVRASWFGVRKASKRVWHHRVVGMKIGMILPTQTVPEPVQHPLWRSNVDR